ncbi:hypothetical protein [Metapseudomonas boanensis]|uniref:Glycine zipper domain-containing protein n=1 Tax=Metapseudomonas boanensis TaxID=2822138 RepID=A0ABS5XGR3_9GAMM|nr:hypothetical protein [Pseudomonas boanensis]MBT8766867.1 hypothetical protein [Pseudomonas boanensis]
MSTQQILGGNALAPGQTAGQIVASIVGAAIGGAVGGPAGAFTGYQVGAEIAGDLDPAPNQQDRGPVSKHLSEGDQA